MRNLLTLADLKAAEIDRIFAITEDLKTKYQQGLREALLPGRVMALLFEKPSLRTRVSFESVADFGRVLSQYVDVVVVRAFHHSTAIELAKWCNCAVINGLTDYAHPCQALADLYTLKELIGRLKGHTLAYIGDANNVAHSLAEGCGKMGMRFVMATPKPYQFNGEIHAALERDVPELDLVVTADPAEAVRDAAAIYTDVWTSMGQEKEADQRRRDFADYQINSALLKHAPEGAFFMHCLPAHRGEEVTDEVIDGPQSIVVQQAANRLHVQKGILAWILAARS
jgi:ornithine carbamoyltransferase